MEPNYPNTNNNPVIQPQSSAPEPRKRWPFSGKVTAIIAVIAVIVIAAILFLVLGGSKSGNNSGGRSATYIQREGYANLDESIGDPLALVSKPSNKVAQYKGSPVVQPCTLLNVADIRGAGLKLTPALQPGAVNLIYLDGQSQQPIQPEISDFGFPFPDDTNRCTYYLTDGERITITTYQPTYASFDAVNREIGRSYNETETINGVKVFKSRIATDAKDTEYLLGIKDVVTVLEMKTANSTATDKLLRTLAEHISTVANAPTPLQDFSYDSPVWKGDVAKPCALFDASSVKTALGKEAGPLVQEKVGGVIGVVKDTDSQDLFNFVSGECDRRTAEKNTSDTRLIVRTDTFETEEGAKAIFEYTSKGGLTKNRQDISPTIGDESFYADTAGMEEAVVFRKGRVIVKMTYVSPAGSTTSADKSIDALRPVAEEAANRLNNF